MRILMLTCDYVPERWGGAQQQCHRLSRALLRAGHQVTVHTSRSSDKVPAHEILDGVKIHPLRVGGPGLDFRTLERKRFFYGRLMACSGRGLRRSGVAAP